MIVKSSRTFVSSSNVDFISELHRRRYEDEEKGWDWTNLLLDEECRMWLKMQYWDSSGLWGPSQHPEKIFSCRKCPPYPNRRRWQGWTADLWWALRLFITALHWLAYSLPALALRKKQKVEWKNSKRWFSKTPLFPSSEKSYLIQTFTFTYFCSPT